MILDHEKQRGVLLELIARAYVAPEEVPGVAVLRRAIATAAVAPAANDAE